MKRWGLLAAAPLGLAACEIYVSIGEWEVVTGGAGAGSGSSSASTTGTGDADQCPATVDGGTPVWAHGYGAPSVVSANSVAVNAAGQVIVAGAFSGSVDFGCGTLAGGSAADLFAVQFDPSGACLWSTVLGAGPQAQIVSTAADASGNLLVTGSFGGSLTFGDTTLTSTGATNLFVAKLDQSGAPLWSERFGSGQSASAGLAVDSAGNVVVIGSFQGSIDFGGTVLAIDGGATNGLFVAKLDPSGTPLWSQGFGNAGGSGVAVDLAGNVLVTGVFTESADFGCGALMAADAEDGFVAKLDSDGSCWWSKPLGTAGPNSIAVDAAGDAFITGTFVGTVDFGGGAFTSAEGEHVRGEARAGRQPHVEPWAHRRGLLRAERRGGQLGGRLHHRCFR